MGGGRLCMCSWWPSEVSAKTYEAPTSSWTINIFSINCFQSIFIWNCFVKKWFKFEFKLITCFTLSCKLKARRVWTREPRRSTGSVFFGGVFADRPPPCKAVPWGNKYLYRPFTSVFYRICMQDLFCVDPLASNALGSYRKTNLKSRFFFAILGN